MRLIGNRCDVIGKKQLYIGCIKMKCGSCQNGLTSEQKKKIWNWDE